MKSLVISVSAGTGCYRHIQISQKATLHKLHEAIISAFDFNDDHLYIFFMDNRYWSHNNVYVREKMRSDDRLAQNCRLEKLNLTKGTQFKYIFDLGDEWRFQCKVLRELEEETLNPMVIRKVGESPEQYPVPDDEDDWDDWDEDEEDDDPDEEHVHEIIRKYCSKLRQETDLDDQTIHLIGDYAEAAGNLYGLISADVLLELYNSENAPVSAEDFISALFIRSEAFLSCAIYSRDDLPDNTPEQLLQAIEIVNDYLLVDDAERDIRKLRNDQRGKPLKILPKNEFLKYADFDYWPATPQRWNMIRYLRKRKSQLAFEPSEFCNCIQRMIACDAPLNETLALAAEDGLTFDSKNCIDEFFDLYQKLNNVTHKHANRGHTPQELFEASERGKKLALRNNPENQLSLFDELPARPSLTLTGVPSRNGPCPCGSGRKYKHCCGKNKSS